MHIKLLTCSEDSFLTCFLYKKQKKYILLKSVNKQQVATLKLYLILCDNMPHYILIERAVSSINSGRLLFIYLL